MWLTSSISDGEIIDNSYVLFRKDRDKTKSNCERGGGVLIAVKRNISTELLEINNNETEQIFIKVKGKVNYIIIGCIYLPPLSSLDAFNNHLKTISHIKDRHPNCKLIVIGDYNLPSSYPQASCKDTLYNEMILANYQQHNIISNDNNRTLDLCFSNADLKTRKANPIIKEDKHYPAINIFTDIQTNLKPNNTPTY